MKKILLGLALLVLVCVYCTGCGTKPHITIDPGGMMTQTSRIDINEGYYIEGYNKQYNNNGTMDVIIHYRKSGE